MDVITDTPALTAFCGRMADAGFITVDTEFIRDKTYWPKLCLVQIAGPDEVAAIDTLAPDIDLAPLLDLMFKPDLLKVFHAARQDFEIFYNMSGRVPAPVFDTQVSAMVCGFGDSAGYETLVKRLTKARIDKTMRFTDWQRRPLSNKQLKYAIDDVTHLRIVYEKLSARVAESGREDWVAEELAALSDPAVYDMDARTAWRRLKLRSTKPRFLAIVRELAAWRETEAQTRDVPRNRVIRDDALLDVASHAPGTVAELAELRSMRGGKAGGSFGEGIVAAVVAGKAVPEADCPVPKPRRNGGPGRGPSVELLKVLLRIKSEQHGVAQKLIANSSDVEAIAEDDDADVPALHGWRRELYGEDALALKHGKLAITVDGNKIRLVPVPKA